MPETDGVGAPERPALMLRSDRVSFPRWVWHRPGTQGAKKKPTVGYCAMHLYMVETQVETTPGAVKVEANIPVTLKAVMKVFATSLALSVCVFFVVVA